VEYDPSWATLFDQERAKLAEVLAGHFLLIEHIGSTAVPGLVAKPVIDIGLGIRRLDDAPDLFPAIESLGYIYEPGLEQSLPERRFFWKGTPLIHTCHLHLAEVDSDVLTRPIRFRDYLRRHPEAAQEYGELKKKLAEKRVDDMEAYVADKTEFVERIMRLA
jgi:GrpB-like predicted nucleotidyltransferase (UPF0157 family)